MKPKPLSGSPRRVFGDGCEEGREGLWKEGGRGGGGGWSEGVFEGLRAREAAGWKHCGWIEGRKVGFR